MRRTCWLALLLAAMIVPAARADSYIANFTCGSGDCFALPAVLFSPFTLESDYTVEWDTLRFPLRIAPMVLTDSLSWSIQFGGYFAAFRILDLNLYPEDASFIAFSWIECLGDPTIPFAACPYDHLIDTNAQYGSVTFTPITPEPSSEALTLVGITFLFAMRQDRWQG